MRFKYLVSSTNNLNNNLLLNPSTSRPSYGKIICHSNS